MNRKYRYNSGEYRKEMLAYRNMLIRCGRFGKIEGYEHVVCCPRWLDSFDNFMDDMGVLPHGYILDRKDNLLGYNKDNCRWVMSGASQFNRRKFKGDLSLPFGVFISSDKKKYVSQICVNHKRYHLGTFKTPAEARLAYEKISLEWYGYIN